MFKIYDEWEYSEWVEDYKPYIRNYKTSEFVVQNKDYMIVFSS